MGYCEDREKERNREFNNAYAELKKFTNNCQIAKCARTMSNRTLYGESGYVPASKEAEMLGEIFVMLTALTSAVKELSNCLSNLSTKTDFDVY